MIQDAFDLVNQRGDADDTVFTMRCKDCRQEFEAHLHLFKTQNCRHVLGRSLTIICPKCKVEGTTTVEGEVFVDTPGQNVVAPIPDKAIQIAELEKTIERMRLKVEDYVKNRKLKFKPVGKPDLVKLVVPMICLNCDREFITAIMDGVNSSFAGNKLIIKCPGCGIVDETTVEQALERMDAVLTYFKLKELELILAKLKGNQYGDSPPQV